MSYMARLMEHFKTIAGRNVFTDAATGEAMKYGELDDLTSRVYAYLSERGIGKESFVMIDLPRGIYTLAVAVGVWRAGAAYVIVDEGIPVKQKDYIYRDCGCTAVIGAAEYARILSTCGRSGYAVTDLHDAAYAVYTSGTTGDPKGVVHEYGTLEDNIAHFKYNGEYLLDKNDRFLLVSPFSFVATDIILNLLTYLCVEIVVAPASVMKDKIKLLSCMAERKITATFFTPSHLRLEPLFHPELRTLFLASEPARNIYIDDVTVYNVYAQSETGYLAGIFKLDRAYDITPVGKAQCAGRELVILDDKGQASDTGALGEICFENPYFRGYVNMSEETERAFEGGIYHSGDIGRKDPDGNVILIGRKDDMAKVNGNRVEPGEIEAAMKSVLHLPWAAARVFADGKNVSICGYYPGDAQFDCQIARQELSRVLPSYMVPTHFMKLARLPMNANGKLSRGDLPRPDITVRSAAYAEPADDVEKILCEGIGKVLDIEKVGALDDFYELGGDSVSSMKLLISTGLDGLTIDMVFRGRTPRQIAGIYRREAVPSDPKMLREQEELARSVDHPLREEQFAAFDYQLSVPDSTMWNIPLFFRVGDQTDLRRLASAVETALKAHGVFSTILEYDDKGEIVQRYVPQNNIKVPVEKTTEALLVDLREELIHPFELIGRPLFRVRIFETEQSGYLFIDMNHLITDGRSMFILLRDIAESYDGKQIREDCYFANLSRLERERLTDIYEKAGDYYTVREASREWTKYPKVDNEDSATGISTILFRLPVYPDGLDRLMGSYSIGKNALVVAAAALSLAVYNDARHVSVLWTYNGRESRTEDDIIGMLIRDITVYLELKEEMTVGDFLKEVREQMVLGLSYSCYPHANLIDMPALCVIYQSELGRLNENSELKLTEEELPNPLAGSENVLDLEIYDEEEGTDIYMSYVSSCYREESMHRFRRMIMKSSALLVQYADEPGQKLYRLMDTVRA